MTNAFASKIFRFAGTAVLTGILASSAVASAELENSEPKAMILFFDLESADLTAEAKSIVLSVVDAAERIRSGQIQLAAFSSTDESANDTALATRRAEAVKALIADYGYRGHVFVDAEAPDPPLVRIGDDVFDRSAVLRLIEAR